MTVLVMFWKISIRSRWPYQSSYKTFCSSISWKKLLQSRFSSRLLSLLILYNKSYSRTQTSHLWYSTGCQWWVVLWPTASIRSSSSLTVRRRCVGQMGFFMPLLSTRPDCGDTDLRNKKYGDVYTFILLGRKVTVYLGSKGNQFILNGKLKDINAEEIYSVLTTPVFARTSSTMCPMRNLWSRKRCDCLPSRFKGQVDNLSSLSNLGYNLALSQLTFL